jgi:acyl-CoA thioesterase I
MMKTLVRLALAIGPLLLPQPGWAAMPANPCPFADEAISAAGDLVHVSEQLKAAKRLDVLAVGSATMFGPEASLAPGTITSQSFGAAVNPVAPAAAMLNQLPSERAFPLQMAKQLGTMIPGLNVDVTVRGGRGMLASEMLEQLRKELAAKHYDLVLWQTGTVEAVRNLPPGEFGQTLSEGAQAVLDAGADLVLVDPQYSRFLQTNSNLDPYFQALQQVSAMPGVILFRRFDLMRGWANDGGIDLERTGKSDREKAVITLHACLGRHLARLVASSIRG